MGVPRASARLLMAEAAQRPFGGRLLQLGRSSIYFRWDELERWARRDGFALAAGVEPGTSHDPRLAVQGCIDDVSFFRALGFDRVESCDIEPWEGAEHIIDLNGEVPAELVGAFDVVFETGTIVQIFDLPRVLENLYRLLKVGGRMVHCAVPSNNHMDLGFYMLCPTFFADFYAANGYRIEAQYLCEYFAYWHEGRLYSDPWRVYEYSPGALEALSYGRYGGAQAATFCVATKLEEATGDRRPQLGQYVSMWSSARLATDAGTVPRRSEPLPSSSAARWWPLKRLVESVRRWLPRRMPRLVAKL